MELRQIYNLSDIIRQNVEGGGILTEDVLKDIEINVVVDKTTHYGIDKEFYFMTHNNSYEGFVHSEDLVKANINGVRFNIKARN